MMTARVLTTILAVAWLAAAAPGKVSKDLSGVDPAATLDVIVQFRNGGTDAEVEKVRQHGGQQKKTEASKGSLLSHTSGPVGPSRK